MIRHWDYFLTLEQDIINLSRFIELSEKNFSTYSIELTHLLLSISSEVDVVSKILCDEFRTTKKPDNMNTYRELICKNINYFSTQTVYIVKNNLVLQPWIEWDSGNNPSWWKSYNKVKHERNINFEEANLKNVLYSISGLFILHVYLKNISIKKGGIMSYTPRINLNPHPVILRLHPDSYYRANL